MNEPIERIDESGRPLKTQACVTCGYEFDCATPTAGETERPHPGDFTLCLKCGEVMVFDEGMSVRFPALSELSELQKDPMQWRLLEVAQEQIRAQRYLG